MAKNVQYSLFLFFPLIVTRLERGIEGIKRNEAGIASFAQTVFDREEPGKEEETATTRKGLITVSMI